MTIQDLARDAYGRFERRERADGVSYWTLRDGAPEWLCELVRAAHDGMLPDDWRYASICAAVGFIADGEGYVDDLSHEFADGNVDTYTGDRLAWLGSHLSRVAYCDEAVDALGYDGKAGIVGLIGLGQYAESHEIFASVADSLMERLQSLAELETAD